MICQKSPTNLDKTWIQLIQVLLKSDVYTGHNLDEYQERNIKNEYQRR